jgi:hypothetical protein
MRCACGCQDPSGDPVHAIVAALVVDDLDAALDAGLLASPTCPSCAPDCTAVLVGMQDARRVALAARERFRARAARLARRQQERAMRRTGAAPEPVSGAHTAPNAPLPAAAAAALARAKAKAAGQGRT